MTPSNDTEGLEPAGRPGCWIAYVDEIHGPGSEVIPVFPITREELLVLAKHWDTIALDLKLFQYVYSQYGSDQMQRSDYAGWRVARIAALLGKEAVRAVREEVEKEMREGYGDDCWEAYFQGDSKFPERMHKEHEKVDAYLNLKREDKQTQDAAFEYLRDNPEGYRIDHAGDLWSLSPGRNDPARLFLKVTTPKGASAWFDRAIDRPDGWRAPFGIR
jgi:hypothetical protein